MAKFILNVHKNRAGMKKQYKEKKQIKRNELQSFCLQKSPVSTIHFIFCTDSIELLSMWVVSFSNLENIQFSIKR